MRRRNQGMDKLTKITRAETTYVEQNWRQGAGGRVLTFDMMLELPHSPKVAALGRNSEIVFDDKRYKVDHTEVVRKSPLEVVRIALNRTGRAAETWSDQSRQPASPTSFSWVGNAPPLHPHT
jgi:hypothetical protein